MATDEEVVQKSRLHLLARDLVNETVTGRVDESTLTKLAELTLPPLKRQWVRDQVKRIRGSQKETGSGDPR